MAARDCHLTGVQPLIAWLVLPPGCDQVADEGERPFTERTSLQVRRRRRRLNLPFVTALSTAIRDDADLFPEFHREGCCAFPTLPAIRLPTLGNG